MSNGAAPPDQPPDIVKIILLVLIPPVGVFFTVGLTLHFWINVILTLLGYLPGLIHAIWVVVVRPGA